MHSKLSHNIEFRDSTSRQRQQKGTYLEKKELIESR